MVVTLAPSTYHAKTVQAFTALPSTCTTQAPHCEVSQPTWVPVRRRFSRRNCTSRVRGSMSAVTGLPFTVSDTVGMGLLLQTNAERPRFLSRSAKPTAVRGGFTPILPRSRRLEQE